MNWAKRGLIYSPRKKQWWNQEYAILPTPVFLETDGIIRIYFATTCKDLFGRITYIDVNADNPSEILYEHDDFILDIGEAGCFDDCGVNISSIIRTSQEEIIFYVGYQRCYRSPYMLFVGGAKKNGDLFERLSPTPIIDRTEKYPFSMAAPYVIFDENIFKMWFWIGKKWVEINGKKYISATIGYAESNDCISWKIIKDDCIVPLSGLEFSVGRPWVIKRNAYYEMFYSVRYVDKLYRLGYAISANGIDWERKDDQMTIDVSPDGWDSQMICYPSVISANKKLYLFYNGNQNGKTGFGYAELIS